MSCKDKMALVLSMCLAYNFIQGKALQDKSSDPTFQQGSQSSFTLMVRHRVTMNRGRLSAGRQL